jgi:hypothetical protein
MPLGDRLPTLFRRCIVLVLSTFDILAGNVGVRWTRELADRFSACVTSFITVELVRVDAGVLHRIRGWGQALTSRIWFGETGETHDAG